MRIACPSCNAVYQVPDEQLSEGQVVRCVRCATDWSPVIAVPAEDATTKRPKEATPPQAPLEPPLTAEPLATEPLAPVRQMALNEEAVPTVVAGTPAVSAQSAARRGMPWLALAWTVSVLAVIGGIAALAVWREAVMQAWPPSVRAYLAMGVSRP